MSEEKSTSFVCPECRSPLNINDGGYSCSSCHSGWPIEHGISKFSKNEFFWSVFDEETAAGVTELAEKGSWNDAIEKYRGTIGDYTVGYIKNLSRADWHILLSLDENSVVVDIGSGWGNIAMNIANRCREYYCGDVNMTNLRLLRCRLRDAGYTNVNPFLYDATDFLRLPFEDNSVDAVILNGVLEWMGNVKHHASPDEMQLAALKEIRRVLRPGGQLYIGIENRYSVSTLRGKPLHFELPFIGLLPRWLSNAVTKMVKGEEHRTYVYALHGYKKIINKAGYSGVDFYWPYPSYHDPNYIIPLKPAWVKRHWFKSCMVSRSPKFRLVNKLKLTYLPFHWLAYSYGMVCRK